MEDGDPRSSMPADSPKFLRTISRGAARAIAANYKNPSRQYTSQDFRARGREMRKNTGKACLGIGLILLSIYAATINPPINKVMASEPFSTLRPVLFTDPDIIEQDVDDEFTVSVKIFNLTDNVWTDPINMREYPLGNLFAVGMNMSWDPAILEHVSHLVKIPSDNYPDGVLYAPTSAVEDSVNSNAGYYKMAYTSSGIYTPAFNNPDQNSTVFDITFRVKKRGACTLKLIQVMMAGRDPGHRIYHEGYSVGDDAWGRGATFTSPGAPVAEFSVWPADLRAGVNKPVMFNASESVDTDGTITDYMWDFGDGSTDSVTNPIINHTYNAVGYRTVGLKVRDNVGLESLQFEQTVRVVEKRDVLVRSVDIPGFPIVHGSVAGINVTVSSDSGAEVPESFQVSLFYRNSTSTNGWTLIGTQSVISLTTDKRLTFSWNTTGTPKPPAGESYFYQVLASATYVPHEANITNNSLMSLPPGIEVPGGDIHDMSITSPNVAVVIGSQTFTSRFILGEEVTVRFKVSNIGTKDEICNITLSFIARNGTLLLPAKEWLNQPLNARALNQPYDFSTTALPAEAFNVTVRVDIAEDRNLANNYGIAKGLRVVKPPVIEISYPNIIYANQSATFDATASRHQDAEGQIVTYTWDKRPEAEVFGDVKNGASVSYSFSSVGNWTVRLRIMDNFGLTFDSSQNRPAALAYRKEIVVDVQRGSEGGSQFPIDPLYIVAAIVVLAIIAVVVIRVIRKPKPSA